MEYIMNLMREYRILCTVLCIVSAFICIIIWSWSEIQELNERQEKTQDELDEQRFKNENIK
jgi:hypothetical protein